MVAGPLADRFVAGMTCMITHFLARSCTPPLHPVRCAAAFSDMADGCFAGRDLRPGWQLLGDPHRLWPVWPVRLRLQARHRISGTFYEGARQALVWCTGLTLQVGLPKEERITRKLSLEYNVERGDQLSAYLAALTSLCIPCEREPRRFILWSSPCES